jgi:hypothetical protein
MGEQSIVRFQVLVAVNDAGEKELAAIKANLAKIAGKYGIPAFLDAVVYEDLAVFRESREMKRNPSKYGYFLAFGTAARDKLKPCLSGDVKLRVAAVPSAWSTPEVRKPSIAAMAAIVADWRDMTAEKAIVASQAEAEEVPKEDAAEWILGHVEDVAKQLELMVRNSRPHALVFHLGGTEPGKKPYVELRDATKKLRAPMDQFIAVVVDGEVLKDQKRSAEVVETVRRAGYSNPTLVDVRQFMVCLRICCELAKDGKARVEFVSEAEGA